jgi:two-component system response regulator RegA
MNNHKSLLLVDDDKLFLETLKNELEHEGFCVDAQKTLRPLNKQGYNYAVIDLRLKGEYGVNVIPDLLALNCDCRIVILSGYSSISSAVKAMKLGAVNFLTKPVSIDILVAALMGEVTENSDSLNKLHTLSSHEHEYIEFVLSQNDGNISKTAKVLGLHRQSLQRKLKKYK